MPDQRQREGMEGRGSHATSKNTAMASFDPMDAGGPRMPPLHGRLEMGPREDPDAELHPCAEIRDSGHRTQDTVRRRISPHTQNHNHTPSRQGSDEPALGKNLGRDRVGLPVMSALGVSR